MRLVRVCVLLLADQGNNPKTNNGAKKMKLARLVKPRNKREAEILKAVPVRYWRYNDCYYYGNSNCNWTDSREEAFNKAEQIKRKNERRIDADKE